MLRRIRIQHGVTLTELMVTLSVLAFLMLMAGPGFSAWLQNSKLRSAAESILAGLQYAKSEAVSRNTVVRFQLTSSMDNSCTLSTTSAHWIVNNDPTNPNAVVGRCAAAPSAAAPFILQKHQAVNSPAGMEVSSTASSIAFNGLGRPVGLTSTTIAIKNSTAGTCAKEGGPVTCLNIVVSPQGQVRMCNPNFDLPDPQGC